MPRELPEEWVDRVMDRRNVREQEDRILSPRAAVQDDLEAVAPYIEAAVEERVRERIEGLPRRDDPSGELVNRDAVLGSFDSYTEQG